jgi:hypothetical protein
MATRLARMLIVGLVAGATAERSCAYNVFPYILPDSSTGYYKWGDNHAGTPGGVVTWSLMPTGTTLATTAPEYIHGTSNLAGVFAQVGGETTALALIQTALDGWAAVANVTFAYVGVDDGTPFDAEFAPGQVLGDIRIGGFEIDGFSGAVGYAAPPNGGRTLAGDIILNSRSDISFYNAPGTEGDLYDIFPPGGGLFRNEFAGLVAHEIGHTIGLAHTDVAGALMNPEVDPDHDGREAINRLPNADDIAGAQFLYGPAIHADFDSDGDVDGEDFLSWQRGLGLSVGAQRVDGDANEDGQVNAADLTAWRNGFATATLATGAVPEPGADVILIWGLLGAISLKRRRGSEDLPL